jgi:hypothetical protein
MEKLSDYEIFTDDRQMIGKKTITYDPSTDI